MSRTQELAAQREALLERSDWLRAELAEHGRSITQSLGLIDRGVALARSGVLRPGLLIAAVGLLLVRPRAAWWLASRGAILWPVVRRLLPPLLKLRRSALSHPGPAVTSTAAGRPADPGRFSAGPSEAAGKFGGDR